MDITTLQSHIQCQKEFTFGNKTILFSKVTSYDNTVSVDIVPLECHNELHPYAYKLTFYFNIYSGSDVSKISIERHLVPSHHKNKIVKKKFLWLIPYEKKTWDSDFWKDLGDMLVSVRISYYNYVECVTKEDPNATIKSFKEWFMEKSDTIQYYNQIKSIHDEFINLFNEWKNTNA